MLNILMGFANDGACVFDVAKEHGEAGATASAMKGGGKSFGEGEQRKLYVTQMIAEMAGGAFAMQKRIDVRAKN